MLPQEPPIKQDLRQTHIKTQLLCMPNMKTIIASHKTETDTLVKCSKTPNQNHDPSCNCRKKAECPHDGKCLQANVVYQTTVTTTESYVGLASNFKERYRNHNTFFRNSNRRNATELSKHIWTLKDANKTFHIKWKVFKKSKPYNNTNKKRNLCLHEKFILICFNL